MQFNAKKQEDFWAGLMFIGFGLIALIVSLNYPIGSAERMGPGYFPRYIGVSLIILGSIITLVSLRIRSGTIRPFAWRGILMLSLGFLIFAWAIDQIGFVLALMAMIFCSSAAGKEFRFVEALALSAILSTCAVILFIYILKLPFPLFGWR